MSLAEYAAVEARLLGGLNLANKVFDTARTNPDGSLIQATYLVLFGGLPDTLASNRFTAVQQPDSDAVYVYTVRAVSPSPDGCRNIAQAAINQLVGFTPTIAGRNCSALALTHSREIAADTAVLPPLYFLDLEFTLTSNKA